MDAVVMAGGMGRRLGKDEKPLTMLSGKPMISYVLSALLSAKNVDRIYVATSPRVEKTVLWLSDYIKEHNTIEKIQTPGEGFVNDMAFTVEKAGITGQVLVIMADLPLVTPELIDHIIEKYGEVQTPALSVHMKLDVFMKLGIRPDTVFHKNGGLIVPCGINILDAGQIREEQEDHNLILEDEELALNVNTKEELRVCEIYLNRMSGSVQELTPQKNITDNYSS